MKTDAHVSKRDPNLRGPKHAKDWICLVVSDFFNDEGPYTAWEAWETDS